MWITNPQTTTVCRFACNDSLYPFSTIHVVAYLLFRPNVRLSVLLKAQLSENTFVAIVIPSIVLSVSVFSIVNSENVDNPLFLVDHIKKPELFYSIAPGVRDIHLKLLDVVTPEGLGLELWIEKGIKLPSQEGGVVR